MARDLLPTPAKPTSSWSKPRLAVHIDRKGREDDVVYIAALETFPDVLNGKSTANDAFTGEDAPSMVDACKSLHDKIAGILSRASEQSQLQLQPKPTLKMRTEPNSKNTPTGTGRTVDPLRRHANIEIRGSRETPREREGEPEQYLMSGGLGDS